MQHYQLGFEWMRFYGKDIILVPLLLIGTQIIGNEIGKPLQVSRAQITIIVAYVSLVFEGIIPWVKPEMNSDPMDILMYATGGLGFYLFKEKFLNKASWKSSKPVLLPPTH